MKYWKEKENNPVENMQFWTGTYITKLAENEIFLYGSNPQGINGAGAAKAAMSLSKGAKHGVGRGFNGSNAYALVTKSLNAGFLEKATGILYDKEGYCSVSPEQIRTNIDELYEIAKSPEHKDKKFLVSYQYESWPNGTPKKSLNGYTSQEMLEMFARDKDVPPNIIFHESYKPHLEKLYKNQNKQSNGELVVYEDDKTLDIKEEDIVWTIDSDERNPEGRHGAGAAKDAQAFGAIYFKGRGLMGQSYALITKNLKPGYIESKTGISYPLAGERSVSPEMIKDNIAELYECAKANKDKNFLVAYTGYRKNLNGYTLEEMADFFTSSPIPENMVFNDTFLPYIVNSLKLKENIKNNPKRFVEPTTPILDSVDDYDYFWGLECYQSNFYPAKFKFRGQEFISSEQFFMYCKALVFNRPVIAKQILDEAKKYQLAKDFIADNITPDEIIKNPISQKTWKGMQMAFKAFGRKIDNYNDTVWNEKRYFIMKEGVKQKFKQNPYLLELMMETNDKFFVEASPYDDIWGIGLNERDARKVGPINWKGKNLLGCLMTEVKNELRLEWENEKQNTVKFQYNFFNKDNKKQEVSQKPVKNTTEDSPSPSGIKVVNFYALDKKIPEDGVYIGRVSSKWGLPQSILANPYPVLNENERASSIEKYRKWLWNQILDGNVTKKDLLDLQNKRIVCYCKPKACHGDVIKSVVDYIVTNEQEFDQKVIEGIERKKAKKMEENPNSVQYSAYGPKKPRG